MIKSIEETEKEDRLKDAALNLYMAGRWSLPDDVLTLDQQANLWIDLREALGLEPGHSTKAGVNR